ncbi:hypothetical protein IIA28_11925 [candidate division KSB1 bacterium]|nr:hypothetical protein [candidate division KSB1 bacterium]
MQNFMNQRSFFVIFISLIAFGLGDSSIAQQLNHKFPHVSIQQSWLKRWQTSIVHVLAKADLIQADLTPEQIVQIRQLNPNATILPFWSVRENKSPSEWWRRDIVDGFRNDGFDGMYVDLWNDQSREEASIRSAELRNWWPDGIHIVNYGTVFDYSYELNGFMWEDFVAGNVASVLKGQGGRGHDDWVDHGHKPTITILNDRLIEGINSTKFDFLKKGRYATGISMLRDEIYVMYNFGSGGSPHWASNWWLDEFDFDIGEPMGEAKTIDECVDRWGKVKSCVWAREFTNGLVIVNDSGEPRTITSSQLASNGLNGPFWRFRGGQDPVLNNGSVFDSVILHGWIYLPETRWWQSGDAILLGKSPQTVVTDIIIDDESSDVRNPYIRESIGGTFTHSGFSYNLDCGADPPEEYECSGPQFPGSWGSHPDYSSHFAGPGSGSNTARWVPTIGLAGKYEIYEWHSSQPNGNATDAPFKIRSADGETSVSVDQSVNGGRWNRLGVFTFQAGQSGFVEVTNKANGLVIADALKFVYRDSDFVADSSPPNPPKGVKVDGK